MTEVSGEMRRGACPYCGAPAPFLTMLSRRGEPFDCPVCASRIVLPKIGAAGIVIVAILLVLTVSGKLPWLALLAALAVGAMVEWLTVRVSLVEPPAAGAERTEG